MLVTPYQPPSQSQQPAGPKPSTEDVGNWYQTYLGRQGSQDELAQWANGPYGFAGQGYIANSPEAQAYKNRPQPAPAATPPPDASGGGGGGNGGIDQNGNYTGGGGGGYGGTSVFDDPATKNFEALLNQRIQSLQTPFNNPDYQPAIDQMRNYLARLNGPAYTPAQTDLMNTQVLDPMEHQRSQAKQQVIQRLAARGIGPSSGITEKALEDVDNQFQQMRTKTQAGFANQAIGLENQNAGLAAQLAPQIAGMQQQNFGYQDTRDQNAVNMAQIIPNMAWSRLTGAMQNVQGINPGSLLSLQQGYQNQGYGQDAGYGNAITQLLMQLFGGG